MSTARSHSRVRQVLLVPRNEGELTGIIVDKARDGRITRGTAQKGHDWLCGRVGFRKDLWSAHRGRDQRCVSRPCLHPDLINQPTRSADTPHNSVLDKYDFGFAENGLTAYKLGQPLATQSFIKFVGEDRYKKLVNFILHYLADIDIPIKRFVLLILERQKMRD